MRPAPLAGPCSTGRRELLAAAAVLLAAVQAPGRARADEPPVVALEGKPETGEAATVTTVPNTAGPEDTAVCTASLTAQPFPGFSVRAAATPRGCAKFLLEVWHTPASHLL